ncbi:MAG: hypothetical protein WCS27_15820, partial [Victivallaceae bacterium]
AIPLAVLPGQRTHNYTPATKMLIFRLFLMFKFRPFLVRVHIREEAMAKGADVAVIYWFDSRFTDAGNHTKECSAHCCCHDHDQYKYKQLVKIALLKRK